MTKNIAYLIIHKEDVERDAINDEKAKMVLNRINEIIRTFPKNCFFIQKGADPRKPPINELKAFDKTIIMGAYHGMCLNSTSITLTMNNIKNELDSSGIL